MEAEVEMAQSRESVGEDRHRLDGQGRLVEARRKQKTEEEKYKFVTSVVSKMKLSAEHRHGKSKDKKQGLDTQRFWTRRYHCSHSK